jgi:hypothetical protein
MRQSIISRTAPLRGSSVLDTPLAFAAVLVVALGISVLVGYKDYLIGLIIAAGLIGGTITFICLFNTRLGFVITTIVGFFMFYIKRMSDDAIPMGVAVDVLTAVTFIGAYYRKTIHNQRIWQYMKNPVSYMYIMYLGFLLIELFNPSMYSVSGWIFTVRKFINFVMIYFVGLFTFNSVKDVKDYMKLWLFLSVLAGAYGCFQQWFGLLGFEEHWVVSDPVRYRLYFQGGDIRKFSFLSDPTAYGILMACSIVFAIVLAMNTKKVKQRNWLIAGIIIMALGMAYSGTRTAYFMIPAGLAIYILMTITNRRTLLFMAGFLMFFVVLMFGPFSGNNTVNRIRTSFHLKDDESMNVRDENRHNIQPYIWRHPIGGGVATSGVLGIQYNPGHPLAGFPPDSGYLRTALETGWIGLIITMTLFFVTLLVGVKGYYQAQTKDVRALYVAIVTGLYAYIVAHYAQVAIGQIPGAFFFYSSMAIIVKMKDFETPSHKHSDQVKSITT